MSLTNTYSILVDSYEETQSSVSQCPNDLNSPDLLDERVSKYEFHDSDCVSIYLRQISKIPLLRSEEESRLFRIIHIAIETPWKTNEEEVYQARIRVLEGNLRLVVKLAFRYRNLGLSFLDLIQEGNIGLIKAIDKFEPEKGYRFNTYATWWVQQSMMRALTDHSRTIRLPAHIVERLNKLNRSIEYFHQKHKTQPTIEDIASEMSLPIEKVRQAFELAQCFTSLDSPVGDEEEQKCIIDVISNESVTSPEDDFLAKVMREKLNEALNTLSPREAEILRLRFGLYDGTIYTLEQLGDTFGITRERVRQIEKKAIVKLRHPKRSAILKEFIE